ncbi:unnamed protein product [Larinioides sclopetarius]|uniref:Uncharacterized protein n=1 Tax=Larinioides sclopetarius TaxID=280406 RepID=A0AAV2BZS9_9ARAC
MDIDPYRLAYNIFHYNWEKFGIPPEDIPPPKTETVHSLDLIIPGFSIAVVLFQIASRKDLKTFLDNECLAVHNLGDVYTRFRNIMTEALPEGTIVVEASNDNLNEGASEDTSEDVSPDELLSENSTELDLHDDIKKNIQPKDAMKESLTKDTMKQGPHEDAMREDLLKDNIKEGAMKQDLSGNKIRSEDIPGLIAYSLAVCTELVLYDREYENNRDYMKFMPEMWEKYFEEHLKPLCEEARCTQDILKVYSSSVKCPEKFLNKFISENKDEYLDIADKFYDYTEKNYAVESPEHSKSITEIRSFSRGIAFLKMKDKFSVLKEICKCVKGITVEEMPLLSDFSPGSVSSSSTTPST